MEEPLRITPLSKDRAATLWPYVRSRLAQAEEEIGQVALPERVYAEWLAGRATVMAIYWQGALSGALVLTGPEMTDSMKRRIWVWVLAVERVASVEMRCAINDWLAKTARSAGASAVAMASTREGWGRYLKSLGWKPVEVQYELEVNRGE